MSMTDTPTYPAQPGQAPPNWPGAPAGYGGGPDGPGGPVRRRRRGLLLAAAVVVAAALIGVPQAARTLGGGTVLTTAQISRQVSPGLVDIVTTLGYQHAQAAGTGLVLTPSGEVLTNNHVIHGATAIAVTDVGNGRTYRASVVGYDVSHDIAVLQLRQASGLTTVALGTSGKTAVGQKVVALGNAGGKGGAPSVVTGQVTGLGAAITASDQAAGTSEQLTGLIHHTAAIQPGDSGGPLVNTAGQVIGINTAASTAAGFQFQSQQPQTQAFAIPAAEAAAIARQIEAGSASATVHIGATGFLGVQITSADIAAAQGVPAGTGAAVAGVLAGSPAQGAGLAAGDVIVAVNGQRISSPSALQSAMQRRHPGDRVRVNWIAPTGQRQSATAVLTTGPAA